MTGVFKGLGTVLTGPLLDQIWASWVSPVELGQIVDLPIHHNPDVVLDLGPISHLVMDP